MFKKIILKSLILLLLSSCATYTVDRRMGTGKPKFATLEIEGVLYEIEIRNGEFKNDLPVRLLLKLKNLSEVKKSFQVNKNKLVILVIKNEFGENLKITDIPSEKYLKGTELVLNPGEELVLEIAFEIGEEIFKDNNSINCQLRLFFLPKQFRRNSLSIYLEKN